VSTGPGAGDETARPALGASEQLQELIQQQLHRAQQLRQESPVREPVDRLEDARKRVQVERAESDLGLSKIVGHGTMLLMGFQVLVIDGGFLTYLAENTWHVPAEIMISWLGAGTLQIVGSVGLVVARHLFPGGKETNETAQG
jgi:hypothetical protein